MNRMKKYSFMVLITVLVLLLIFLPGVIFHQNDEKFFGKIHVENVSTGRNALLAALTLEERIALYCNSTISPELLFGWLDNSSIAVDNDLEAETTLVQYSYEIEDDDYYKKTLDELDFLIDNKIISEKILPEEKNSTVTGRRLYLYSEKLEYGAVFACIEKQNKNGSGIRFIMDEESGKIIALYRFGKKDIQEYCIIGTSGREYLDYLGIAYKTLENDKIEQSYAIGANTFFYRLFINPYEMALYPMI